MHTYGLIGYKLGYSFSAGYFTEKFKNLNITNREYVNFELDTIQEFPTIFSGGKNIAGLNCTIPYKQEVMQFLDDIDSEAATIGAVNTIKIVSENNTQKLVGYNTDASGFRFALEPMLTGKHKKALILGTGGASKAIKHVLTGLGIDYLSVSRSKNNDSKIITYDQINDELISESKVIINSTPLGTFPDVDDCADLPYRAIGNDHVLFDLVYNPEVTKFLGNGAKQGAKIKNGLEMLHGQAEASWEIWNR